MPTIVSQELAGSQSSPTKAKHYGCPVFSNAVCLQELRLSWLEHQEELVLRRSVRSVAVDPSNEWFVTGSGDRTIKFWDLASGQLKLTLTGHIEQVTGLAISPRHPYMFSCALDKMVKCWDLEYNKASGASESVQPVLKPIAELLSI